MSQPREMEMKEFFLKITLDKIYSFDHCILQD